MIVIVILLFADFTCYSVVETCCLRVAQGGSRRRGTAHPLIHRTNGAIIEVIACIKQTSECTQAVQMRGTRSTHTQDKLVCI